LRNEDLVNLYTKERGLGPMHIERKTNYVEHFGFGTALLHAWERWEIQWLENLKGRDHSEDLGIDGKTILEWSLGKWGWESVDWIHLAQDRDQ